MKTAYLDCASGISGDMTLGALIDAGVPWDDVQQAIDSLGLPSCHLERCTVKRCGMRATNITVEHEPEHVHRHLRHIVEMIDGSRLSPAQQELAKRIFTRLAEAEAKVHDTTVEKVHFHEVGAVDSIADVVGAAVGFDLLGAEQIVCSPIPTGTGTVKIAHGRCSIPAPATAELLKGVPLVESSIAMELTTPTGAAIAATVADRFGPLPTMTVEQIGYGAGDRDLTQQPNVLRLMVGTAGQAAADETVWLLETNLDDVTGELIGYCSAQLMAAGALDVFTTAIGMKKNRPAVKLTVLCREAQIGEMETILFRETTTLGVRRWPAQRHVLARRAATVDTPYGPIEGKVATLAGGESFSPEFESCRAAAEQHQAPLRDVFDAARKAFR